MEAPNLRGKRSSIAGVARTIWIYICCVFRRQGSERACMAGNNLQHTNSYTHLRTAASQSAAVAAAAVGGAPYPPSYLEEEGLGEGEEPCRPLCPFLPYSSPYSHSDHLGPPCSALLQAPYLYCHCLQPYQALPDPQLH